MGKVTFEQLKQFSRCELETALQFYVHCANEELDLDDLEPVLAVVDRLDGFPRPQLRTSLQVYRKLNELGHSFDDLSCFIDNERAREVKARNQYALRTNQSLTREQKRSLKRTGRGGRRRRNDNS